MVPCHNSHHTAVKIHWKNVLLHFKDLVFHCFLYIVPYFLGAIWSFIFILHLLPHRHPLHLASLLLIRHELDFRLWKSSNWIFQDKSNGEETTHSQNGWGWKALPEIICQLVECVLPLTAQVTSDDVKTALNSESALGDTPPVNGVQLNFVALITTLSALQLIQFSIPYTVHFPVCTSLACLQGWMGCRVESLTTASNINCCNPIHHTSHWRLSGWPSTISPS